MPEVTKRLLTDETGQNIVTALGALTNVVDPNGTAVAAAAKLNNMTTSITILAANATPTSSLTVVDGHFHLSLGVPLELPVVTSSNNGQILKVDNGVWTVSNPPTDVPAVDSEDDGKILQVNNGEWTAANALPTVMTGATSNANGASGLVPAPASSEIDKFLSGDGTYKSGGLPMVILSYGSSTWNDFISAYRNNVIVYCRASSNANPGSGSQTRMAFMAYVNDANNPNMVEFQYYRSLGSNARNGTNICDQVFVYTLNNSSNWSVTTRETGIKQVVMDSATGLQSSFNASNGTLTISPLT